MIIIIISNKSTNNAKASASEILYKKLKKEGFNIEGIDSISMVYPYDRALARIFINAKGKTEAYISKVEHRKYGLGYLLSHGKTTGKMETLSGNRIKILLTDLK